MNEENSTKSKVFKIILIAIIAIILILIILELTTKCISRSILKENKIGNTSGNIINYGYTAEDNKYIYYMSMSEDGRYLGISKANKKDLTGEHQRIFEGESDIAGINVLKDYIYFVTLKENEENSSNSVDNKIHRMKKDGSDHKIINDNEFHDNCYQIYAIDNKVYYIGTDECIWYMDLDGDHKTKLNNDKSGYVAITDKYIFYNIYKDKEKKEIVTYMMDLDGKNAKEVNGKSMTSINVVDDYIYYLTSDNRINRIKTDGTEDTLLSDKTAYLFNVSKDGIFYINYYYIKDNEDPAGIAIYRMDLDGKNVEQITRLSNTSSTLGVLDDWIYYMDSYEDQIKIELISFDGKQKYVLYKLDYADYYYMEDTQKAQDSNTTQDTNTANENASENENTIENTNNETANEAK